MIKSISSSECYSGMCGDLHSWTQRLTFQIWNQLRPKGGKEKGEQELSPTFCGSSLHSAFHLAEAPWCVLGERPKSWKQHETLRVRWGPPVVLKKPTRKETQSVIYALLEEDLHTRYHLGGRRTSWFLEDARSASMASCSKSQLWLLHLTVPGPVWAGASRAVPPRPLAVSWSSYSRPAVTPCVTAPFHGNAKAGHCFPSLMVEGERGSLSEGREEKKGNFFFLSWSHSLHGWMASKGSDTQRTPISLVPFLTACQSRSWLETRGKWNRIGDGGGGGLTQGWGFGSDECGACFGRWGFLFQIRIGPLVGLDFLTYYDFQFPEIYVSNTNAYTYIYICTHTHNTYIYIQVKMALLMNIFGWQRWQSTNQHRCPFQFH